MSQCLEFDLRFDALGPVIQTDSIVYLGTELKVFREPPFKYGLRLTWSCFKGDHAQISPNLLYIPCRTANQETNARKCWCHLCLWVQQFCVFYSIHVCGLCGNSLGPWGKGVFLVMNQGEIQAQNLFFRFTLIKPLRHIHISRASLRLSMGVTSSHVLQSHRHYLLLLLLHLLLGS